MGSFKLLKQKEGGRGKVNGSDFSAFPPPPPHHVLKS